MKDNSKKSNTLLKSIITLIVTLLLGTTAWNGVQENVSNDNNYNTNANQTINTEDKNDVDITTDTSNSSSNIQSNTSENTLDSDSNGSQSNDVVNTEETSSNNERTFTFRTKKLLDSHYEKHGKEMGFASAKEYEAAASKVVTNKEALHKVEAEDGDDVYYIESTNEFVVVSTDGYLRTYFYPSDGLDYFNRQ